MGLLVGVSQQDKTEVSYSESPL